MNDLIARVPNWSEIVFPLFLDDNFFEYSFNGLLATVRELGIEIFNDLQFAVERNVAGVDQLNTVLQDSVRITLSRLVDLLRLCQTEWER